MKKKTDKRTIKKRQRKLKLKDSERRIKELMEQGHNRYSAENIVYGCDEKQVGEQNKTLDNWLNKIFKS